MFEAFDSALRGVVGKLKDHVYGSLSEKIDLFVGVQHHPITESLVYCLSRNPPLNSDVLLEEVNENMKLRGKWEMSRDGMIFYLDKLERSKMAKRVGPFLHRKYTIKNIPNFLSDYVRDIVEEGMTKYGYH